MKISSLILLCIYVSGNYAMEDHHKLLLLSIDGLRWDHTDDLSAFRYVEENGVRAKYMKPAFPSHTSPCHMSIATGLYAESHGVVHNAYFDVKNNKTGQTDYYGALLINEWFDNGQEPIWITAASQGLKSGAYYFPGSNSTYNGRMPTKSYRYTSKEPTITVEKMYKMRIDEVLSWFTQDDYDFVALYIEGADGESHEFGPDSKEVRIENKVIDRTLQYLLDRVKISGIENSLNIIILSDHGQLDVKASYIDEKGINLTKYLSHSWINFSFSYGPLGLIEPVPAYKTVVYEALKNGHKHMDVYYKEDIPTRYHYKNNERIPSIVVVAHPGYQMYDKHPGYETLNGDHGYDNELEQMRTVYYSIGPSFKKGKQIEGFESIHVYSLMCHLLGLHPAPNNGSLDVLYPTLIKEDLFEEEKMERTSFLYNNGMILMTIVAISSLGYYIIS